MIVPRLRVWTPFSRWFLFPVLFVSGCAAAYSPTPLPMDHPANPAAPEAPLPPPSQSLRSEPMPPISSDEAPVRGLSTGARHGGHE